MILCDWTYQEFGAWLSRIRPFSEFWKWWDAKRPAPEKRGGRSSSRRTSFGETETIPVHDSYHRSTSGRGKYKHNRRNNDDRTPGWLLWFKTLECKNVGVFSRVICWYQQRKYTPPEVVQAPLPPESYRAIRRSNACVQAAAAGTATNRWNRSRGPRTARYVDFNNQ